MYESIKQNIKADIKSYLSLSGDKRSDDKWLEKLGLSDGIKDGYLDLGDRYGLCKNIIMVFGFSPYTYDGIYGITKPESITIRVLDSVKGFDFDVLRLQNEECLDVAYKLIDNRWAEIEKYIKFMNKKSIKDAYVNRNMVLSFDSGKPVTSDNIEDMLLCFSNGIGIKWNNISVRYLKASKLSKILNDLDDVEYDAGMYFNKWLENVSIIPTITRGKYENNIAVNIVKKDITIKFYYQDDKTYEMEQFSSNLNEKAIQLLSKMGFFDDGIIVKDIKKFKSTLNLFSCL